MSKILTIEEQLHIYKGLEEIFEDLTLAQKNIIISALGLQDIFDGTGLAPVYSLDIISDTEYFLNPELTPNINLTAKVYNFNVEISFDRVVSWKWIRNSGSPSDATWEKTTKDINITAADLTDKIKENPISFTLKAVLDDGNVISDTVKFSNSLALSKIQIRTDNLLFIDSSPLQILAEAVAEGFTPTQYSWFLNDQFVSSSRDYTIKNSSIPLGTAAILRLEAKDNKGNIFTDTTTIPRLKNGTKGDTGVPGPQGPTGETTYTWIKYADDEQGANMSDYPVNLENEFRPYIGYAYNKLVPEESNNPSDYTWSKYIGDEGVPGENGYMWVVYSQYPEGLNHLNKVDVHNDPYDEVADEYMVYLGLAYNKQEKTEPNFNAMTSEVFKQQEFYWSKIRGEDGHTGYILDSDNDIIAFPADSEGNIIGELSGNVAKFSLYYGNDLVNLGDLYTTFTQTGGVESTSTTVNGVEVLTVEGIEKDKGFVTLSVYSDPARTQLLISSSIQILKLKNTPAFNIVTSVSAISVSPGLTETDLVVVSPKTLEVKVMKNTGYEIMETSEGTLTYKYNFQTGDGQALEPDSSGKYTIPISNAGNPKHIELQYFHPIVSNKVADRETIPFVRDGVPGAPGEDGQDGAPGEQGPPGVPGSRGPMARMLEWREGYTYYRNAEYRDYIYYRSDNTTYEGWYCVREVAANLYDTTVDGVKQYKAVANTGSPDTAIFQKQDFVDSQVFGTIIAENANIGGLILRNQKLYSQGMTGSTPNIVIDGKTGYTSFIAAEINNSRFQDVEIEEGLISDVIINNAEFKGGFLEMYSEIVPANTGRVAISNKSKSFTNAPKGNHLTFFSNQGNSQEDYLSRAAVELVANGQYRDGILLILHSLPTQQDINNPSIAFLNGSVPTGTVYVDNNGFLKIKQ